MDKRVEELLGQLLHHMRPTLWVAFTQPNYSIVTRRNPQDDARTRCEMVTKKLEELQALLRDKE